MIDDLLMAGLTFQNKNAIPYLSDCVSGWCLGRKGSFGQREWSGGVSDDGSPDVAGESRAHTYVLSHRPIQFITIKILIASSYQ